MAPATAPPSPCPWVKCRMGAFCCQGQLFVLQQWLTLGLVYLVAVLWVRRCCWKLLGCSSFLGAEEHAPGCWVLLVVAGLVEQSANSRAARGSPQGPRAPNPHSRRVCIRGTRRAMQSAVQCRMSMCDIKS